MNFLTSAFKGRRKILIIFMIIILSLITFSFIWVNNYCESEEIKNISKLEKNQTNLKNITNINNIKELISSTSLPLLTKTCAYLINRDLFKEESQNSRILEFFGYYKDYREMTIDLMIGILAGLILYFLYLIAFYTDLYGTLLGEKLDVNKKEYDYERSYKNKKLFVKDTDYSKKISSELENSWLHFIADKWWKIIPIGVFYFILMQIPFLNKILETLMLSPLINTSPILEIILKSSIYAFLIGILPSIVQAFKFYMLRRKYKQKIIYMRYSTLKRKI